LVANVPFRKVIGDAINELNHQVKENGMTFTSLWNMLDTKKSKYPQLDSDLEVDVLIIGGGITGVTAAMQLLNSNKTVAVVEASTIGGVTTTASTGNLYIPVQPFYQNIVNDFDFETAKIVAYSRQFAMNYIENQVIKHDIKCQFHKRPWYAYTAIDKNCSILDKEMELFKNMDVEIDYVDSLPFDLNFNKAACMPHQARFNPLRYVHALAHYLHGQGHHLFEHTAILSIEEEKKHCVVTTTKAKIRAKKVFIATHTPIGIHLIHTYTAAYRSYVVAVTLKNKSYPEGHLRNLDYSSLTLCTHATKDKPDLLLVSGSHHKTGQGEEEEHYQFLKKFLQQSFDVEEIVYQWSAQHYHSADKLPYFGLVNSSSQHTYMATGYFADGLVYGTLAGIIIGDLLAEKQNEFFSVYRANRHKFVKSLPFLLKENFNVFYQYLQDTPLLSEDYSQLKKGEGKIVEIKKVKYGLCRDKNNMLHKVSAVCPHMKCIVKWNKAEQTWDCPCHGSRFTQEGKFIEGPAMQDLTQFKL
jgi:glycine/D-amino acid oxidase-like deaminating enzyme/nitrite reductase/ring-hydroxylating ferredoxin subunit